MSKQKIILIGSAGFLALLAKADTTTDFKALFEQAVGELGEGEQLVISLNGVIDANTNKIIALNSLIENLENDLKVSNDNILDLNDELKEANQLLESAPGSSDTGLEAELEEALAEIGRLSAKLNLQELTRGQNGIVVEVGGENKLLIGKKFRIKKVDYTAQQVADSPELLDHLHTTGSGSLVDPVLDGKESEE